MVMFCQPRGLAKKHTVHLSYVMFYSLAYEDAEEECVRVKKNKMRRN